MYRLSDKGVNITTSQVEVRVTTTGVYDDERSSVERGLTETHTRSRAAPILMMVCSRTELNLRWVIREGGGAGSSAHLRWKGKRQKCKYMMCGQSMPVPAISKFCRLKNERVETASVEVQNVENAQTSR